MTFLSAVGALLFTFGPVVATISAANLDGTRRLLFRGGLYNGIAQFVKLFVLASFIGSVAIQDEDDDSIGMKTWITAALGVVDWYLVAYLLRDKYTLLMGRSRVLGYALALAVSDLALSHIPLIWRSMSATEANNALLITSMEGTVVLAQRFAMTAAVWVWSRARFSEKPMSDRALVWSALIASSLQLPINKLLLQACDSQVYPLLARFLLAVVLGAMLWSKVEASK